jgi:signal peptidase II
VNPSPEPAGSAERPTRFSRTALRWFGIALALSTIGCDQVTKKIAATHLAGTPRQSFLGDTLRLEYAENMGAFLGLGSHWSPEARALLFVVGSAIGLIAVAVMAMKQPWATGPRFGLALVLAGGLSNLLDRIFRGSVIDFLNVGVGSLRTGIFNVADMALMLGIGLVIFGSRPEEPEPARGDASAPPT